MKKLKSEVMPPKKENMIDRSVWLDFLKILSAFLVVFYHLAFFKLDYGFDSNTHYYIPSLNRIIMSFAACSVPLFLL